MNLSLVINATTDHYTITLNPPATFTLDGTQWEIRHENLEMSPPPGGGLPANPDHFYCPISSTQFGVAKTDWNLNSVSAVVRINVPDGTPYITFSVNRGGAGSLVVQASTPSSGTVNASTNGTYQLPLTTQGVHELEVQLGLVPKPTT